MSDTVNAQSLGLPGGGGRQVNSRDRMRTKHPKQSAAHSMLFKGQLIL